MTEARRLSGLTYVVTKEPDRLCDTAYSFLECGRSIRAATVESKVSLSQLLVETTLSSHGSGPLMAQKTLGELWLDCVDIAQSQHRSNWMRTASAQNYSQKY